MDQREDVVLRDLLQTLEEVQLDDELEPHHLAAELLDELRERLRGAAGRQHVVVDEHARAVAERVGAELERVRAVLERVLLASGFS